MFPPKMFFPHISYMSAQIQSSGKLLHKGNCMCTQT